MTHSYNYQVENGSSGGQSEFVSVLAKAATTTAISGIFMETHENPKSTI